MDQIEIRPEDPFDDDIVCPECGSREVYLSSHCNHPHCMQCGAAIDTEHAECWIPPAALRAERDGDNATAVALMKGRAVWVRVGDADDYHPHASAYDAGYEVGARCGRVDDEPDVAFIEGGVIIPPTYVEQNYISVFVGDWDAQWIRDLNAEEKREFVAGLYDAL